jgi:SAM-dependent methyltransferase
VSNFSDVDGSGAAVALATYLTATDGFLAAMKSYMAEAIGRRAPDGVIVDIGCGLGYDLERLATRHLQPIGLDASAEMLARARSVTTNPLVRGDAMRLPFASGSVDGCRVERTLQHVESPAVVLAEVARVLRPGGVVAVFDSDFGTFRIESDVVPDGSLPVRFHRVPHPRIGGEVVALLEAAGCQVRDVVTESSRCHRLRDFPLDAERLVERAVAEGAFDEPTSRRWLDEQKARSADGTFRADWDKILVLATRLA